MKRNKGIKKWVFSISLFVLFLMFPASVNALELLLVGDASVSPGTTVSYDLVLNSSDELELTSTIINGFSTNINYESSVLTLSKIELGNGWSGDTASVPTGKNIKFSSELGVSVNSTVATLFFKVNANATSNKAYITLAAPNYSYMDESGGSTIGSLDTYTKNLNVKSSDNKLASIKVNGDTIEEFQSDVYEYDISVPSTVDIATILATTKSSKATLKEGSGNRDVSLNYGSNVVSIIVVSESGLEQSYTLNITREDTRSTDTSLSDLKVDGVTVPKFKDSTYKYTIKKYKASSVEVVGVANDKNASVTVTPPSSLVIGENNYIVTVTSENGNSAIYTVVINNIDTPINKKLKTLAIKGYNDINFDKNNSKYEINYNKEKFKDLRIYYTTVSGSDEVTSVLSPDINNDKDALAKLKPGDEITISITGIDNETATYTIVILEDNRVNFFVVLGVFLIIVLVIIIIVLYRKRKKEENMPKVVKKKTVEKNKNSNKDSGEKSSKKKKFSIYEDDEVEENDDYSATKELSSEELKLK